MANVSATNKKSDWVLTQSAFDMLLARLDADRDQAGQKYEGLRRKLIRFAGFWCSPFPEELVDETISRTARKISEGEQIENLNAYTLRIAHLVHLEFTKREIKQRSALQQKPAEQPSDPPDDEARQRCYRKCFHLLPADEKDLIVKYYAGQTAPDREKLSLEVGKPLNSLRVAAFRIRKKLATCLQNCLGQQKEM